MNPTFDDLLIYAEIVKFFGMVIWPMIMFCAGFYLGTQSSQEIRKLQGDK